MSGKSVNHNSEKLQDYVLIHNNLANQAVLVDKMLPCDFVDSMEDDTPSRNRSLEPGSESEMQSPSYGSVYDIYDQSRSPESNEPIYISDIVPGFKRGSDYDHFEITALLPHTEFKITYPTLSQERDEYFLELSSQMVNGNLNSTTFVPLTRFKVDTIRDIIDISAYDDNKLFSKCYPALENDRQWFFDTVCLFVFYMYTHNSDLMNPEANWDYVLIQSQFKDAPHKRRWTELKERYRKKWIENDEDGWSIEEVIKEFCNYSEKEVKDNFPALVELRKKFFRIMCVFRMVVKGNVSAQAPMVL